MTPPTNKPWQGYTLDEMRYLRARNTARVAAERIKLARQWNELRTGNPVTRSWRSMRDIFSAIGYANSAVLAWQLGKRVLGLVRTIRGK
ncbi:MAG: hypothetical protein K2L21_10455 [Muribaculaceae bacterium]|nr:hypothetical protein [Muribaculaceae bacterium]